MFRFCLYRFTRTLNVNNDLTKLNCWLVGIITDVSLHLCYDKLHKWKESTVVPVMNGHPRDQAKVFVHCRWPLIRGNLTLKCVGRGIDNVAIQGRWPLTTGVAHAGTTVVSKLITETVPFFYLFVKMYLIALFEAPA